MVLDGADLVGLAPYLIARAGIGYVPQDRRIFPDLTVRENLEVGRRPGRSGDSPWTLERVEALFPELGTLAGRRGGSLSGGEQQMLTLARTLMGNPRVLLLDEPSEGLAPVVVRTMIEQLLQLKAGGMTILLSEQNVHFTREVSDRAYILEKGSIQREGSIREILEDRSIFERYLGYLKFKYLLICHPPDMKSSTDETTDHEYFRRILLQPIIQDGFYQNHRGG